MSWSTDTASIPAGVNNPRGLAVDRIDRWLLVAADTDLIYISLDRGSTWGTGVRLPTGVLAPRGLAVDTNGNFLLLDAATDGIYVSADDGATWGSKINLPAGMFNPSGMSVDRNGDWLVVGYTLDGIYVSSDKGATWGGKINLPSGVNNPTGLAVTLDGRWLLIDQGTDRIYVSSDKGATWATGESLPSGATLPRGLAVDIYGNRLLADAQTDKIYTYVAAKPTYRLEIDWDGDGNFANAYSEVFDDVLSCTARRGRDYGSMVQGKSIAGVLRATLRNDSGRYSRFNALSPLHELVVPGRAVRLRMALPGDSVYTTIWGGDLFEIKPNPRAGGNDDVSLLAYGPLAQLTQQEISAPMQSGGNGVSTGDAATTILEEAGFGVNDRGPVNGNRRMARWWVARDKAIDALRAVEDTELGFVYETKDGKPAMAAENARLAGGIIADITVADDRRQGSIPIVSLEPKDPIKGIVNVVEVPVRNYTVAASAVLWQLDAAFALAAGATITLRAEYPPSNGGGSGSGSAIGAQSWDALVSGTDYMANAAADGTGTDLTSRLSVTATDTASSRVLTVRNTHADDDLYVTKLQCRGEAVTEGEPVVVIEKDQDSIDLYDEKTYLTPSNFISDVTDAASYGSLIVTLLKAPTVKADVVADVSDSLATARDLELSNVADVVVNGEATFNFVEAIEHRLARGGRHQLRLTLSPVGIYGNVIILDHGPGLGSGILAR